MTTTGEDKQATTGFQPAFRASWIDRFGNWVDGLTVPGWLFYTALGLVVSLLQLVLLFVTGEGLFRELAPVVIFNGFLITWLLGLMHFLDRQAMAALATMRPVLDVTEREYAQYRYGLGNMPWSGSLLSGLALMTVVILMETLVVTPVRYGGLDQLPIFTVVYQLVDKGTAFLFGVFIYHTVRQMRLIHAITTQRARISLFNPSLLQAFAPVTALTAVALIIGVYGWLLINPDLLVDPLVIGFTAVATVLAVGVFVLPLYGVHRRMKAEKDRMLLAVDLEFESLFVQFNQALREDDYAALDRLNGTINGLGIQRARIEELPVWPWRPGTAQAALTAILLPLVVQMVGLLATRLLDG